MTNRKKIVFLIADISCVGGIERVNSLLSNGFINTDYDVEIISLYKTNENINYYLNKNITVSYINNDSYTGRPGSVLRLIKHLLSFRKLNKKLNNTTRNYTIVNSFPMAILAFPACLFSKSRFIVIEHVHAFYYKKPLRTLRSLIYKSYDAIVALTEQDKLFYNKKHPNVYKIENPLSFDTEIKADIDSKKIIAVGRLEKQKGFDLLINAYSQIDKKIRSGWTLNIYGQGGEKEHLQSLIEHYNLGNEVFLHGIVSNISEIYNKHSIFTFSSRFEGFGMVLVEAMNSGLSCISFDCPTGPKDILLNGEVGILIENGNVNKFGLALKNLMMNDELRLNYSKKSIVRSNDFKLDAIIKKWKELFMSVD
ncbi:glycosyltransferase family 4 protein [Providencia rettgeri]|uniref:glycosyltransferase family 4 protein n=1 Tax=Providencia rettgeri TaxID=587 RepID=UPI00065DFA62|nr:glycosyltransferase family 4 protein [Providencia rettgeri]ELR5177262.1 glycosyltransferase family 4 protein [Providencia rettgeri]